MHSNKFAASLSLTTFILCAASYSIFGQNYTITQSIIAPTTFYVGDRAEAIVSIRYQGSEALTIPDPLPDTYWIDIVDIQIFPGQDETNIQIIFVPFRPGIQTLPAINLGHIILHSIDIHVASILPEASSGLAPLRGQFILPTTPLLIAIVILIIIGIPSTALWVYRPLYRLIKNTIQKYRDARPYRELNKTISSLSDTLSATLPIEFYIRLMDDLKRYLSYRLRRNCLATTTKEILSHLIALNLNNEQVDALQNLFNQCDLVKFAHHSASEQIRAQHIEILREFVTYSENHFAGKKARVSHEKNRKHLTS